MLTTSLLLSLAILVTIASLILIAWLLWLGARWAKISEITFRRSLAVVAIYSVLGTTANVALMASAAYDRQPIVALILLLATFSLTWKIVQRGFRTSFGKAILAWLPTLLFPVVVLPLIAFVVKPYVLEGFAIPTGGMAPTIAGDRYLAACPHCNGNLFITAVPGERPFHPELGICSKCLRASTADVPAQAPVEGDRILSLKFLQPQRWDVITFLYPEDPNISYVKRLVGLPGEEIAIRDGEIWIDGQVSERPPELDGLEYTPWPGSPDSPLWKSSDWGPAKLGEDEYFVLGDFSRASADSRVWREGAPGHHAYAVPRSYLTGVVTHIYWPPSRWRAFR